MPSNAELCQKNGQITKKRAYQKVMLGHFFWYYLAINKQALPEKDIYKYLSAENRKYYNEWNMSGT